MRVLIFAFTFLFLFSGDNVEPVLKLASIPVVRVWQPRFYLRLEV